MNRKNLIFPVLAAFGATLASSPASLLLYEGFDYGVADATSINGVASNATGTQGAWAVNNTIPSGGGASSTYRTSGLTFGSSFQTSAGALRLSATYSGQNAASAATVQLNTTATGTVWSSYLGSFTTISLVNGGSLLAGIGSSALPVDSNSMNFKSGLISNAAATDRKLANGYDPGVSTVNFNLATGTTYLFISKYTNVGTALSAGTTGVGTTWALTQAQYETWLAGGASARSVR